ncbi:translocation/assembly module TamB domain-containing protein [Synechococcus sp. KORDI-52]|uniref:translocation/assembly module TamB domain-containing protein n=1 Tax=Synechococcus sp. KORDI-52 TaxID=585425 RepID=UPI00056DDAFE|nr:translocation/assembly module TamB domain-containing protein [Synechococcus sp. KORDI-52]
MGKTRRRAWLAAGSFVLIGVGTAGFIALDRAAERALVRFRPDLERALSAPLGHPLKIGPYKGLRPWGFAIGPTRVPPSTADRSELSLAGLDISLAPLASLRRLQPVVQLTLHNVRGQLEANQEGRYWTFGAPRGSGDLPRLGLQYRLADPALLRLGPQRKTLELRSQGSVLLGEAFFSTESELRWVDGQGSVRLDGQGHWDRPSFRLRSRLDRVALQPLEAVIAPSQDQKASGELQGDVQISWTGDSVNCRGGVRLTGLQLASVRSPRFSIGCQGDQLKLEPGTLRFGSFEALASGAVVLNKSFDLRAEVRSSDVGPARKDPLQFRIQGPWEEPQWTVQGQLRLPEAIGFTTPLKLDGQWRTPWLQPEQQAVLVDRLRLSAPGLRFGLAGTIGADLDLRSTELQIDPRFWSAVPSLQAGLGQTAPITGAVDVSGALASPDLALQLGQAVNPLLERWSFQTRWSTEDSALVLDRFTSPMLRAEARLPLKLEQGRLQAGALQSGFELQPFELSRFTPLIGLPLDGRLAARGRLNGPLSALQPDITLMLDQPRVGVVQVPERWQGSLSGELGRGARLAMTAQQPAEPGTLVADLDADVWPKTVRLDRGEGQLRLDGLAQRGGQRRYRWRAADLDIDGLRFIVPPVNQPKLVAGRLTGEGSLAMAPLAIRGSAAIAGPSLAGVAMESLNLEGSLTDGRFLADAALTPLEGSIRLKARGDLGGRMHSAIEAEGLDVTWLTFLARQLRGGDSSVGLASGTAKDLGTLVINTFGGSLDGQLRALAQSRRALAAYDLAHPSKGPELERLEGRVNLSGTIEGPDLSRLQADLVAKAHLWIEGDDQVKALQLEPVVATLRGPLSGGSGDLSLLQLPLSLLALLAPVPSQLRGSIGIRGRYDLSGKAPLLVSDLLLDSASLAGQPLQLEQRSIVVDREAIRLDLALRAGESKEAITVSGDVPFDPDADLNLTLESHGDALGALTLLAGESLTVRQGGTDLRLLLRGSLKQPQANGFLVVTNGDLSIGEQELSRIRASILFDFDRVLVQNLEAEVGRGGTLSASGTLGLFAPQSDAPPLTLQISQGQIRQPIVQFQADGELQISGAMVQPVLSGALTLSRGTLRPQSGFFGRLRRGGGGLQGLVASGVEGPSTAAQPSFESVNELLEEKWDFQEPLVLMGPNQPIRRSDQLQRFIPNLPAIRFENLRLALGPDLQVLMPPLISFKGDGALTLNGPLDPSLEARGLIRLNSGRIWIPPLAPLRLDPQEANVAVFTPSLGLVPYVDIAMQSRVADSVSVGSGNQITTSNVFDTNGSGSAYAGGGELRLVKVTVQATGLANRLADPNNLVLRSSPPMSEQQLLGLIGGNTLASLGGTGGAALATVLGQSLLSPVLGTLTDAMGQRLQVAIFPTYVNPDVKSETERTSGRVPPTLTVVTEFGVAVTDKFDLSVLMAPNTTDVPPQATVSYQLTPSTSVSGSVDANGTWQSQLQVFFRF